jgi:hypothetical protein
VAAGGEAGAADRRVLLRRAQPYHELLERSLAANRRGKRDDDERGRSSRGRSPSTTTRRGGLGHGSGLARLGPRSRLIGEVFVS